MKTLGITKVVTKSHDNLIGAGMDSFSSANTSKYFNQKLTEINERMHEFSVANRQARNPTAVLEAVPPVMLGEEAIEKGYVDAKGNYFDILKSLYPEC
jgi:ClpP class serine protease